MNPTNASKRKYTENNYQQGSADKKTKINSDNNDVDNLIYALRESTISDNHMLIENVNRLMSDMELIKKSEIKLTKQITKLKETKSQQEFDITLLKKKNLEFELEIINLKETIMMLTTTSDPVPPITNNSDKKWTSYIT